jgi:hypothetical protein
MAVNLDYNDVVGVSPEEFKNRLRCEVEEEVDPNLFTKSDQQDIAKIERLLDVKEGALAAAGDFYIGRMQCECGRLLTSYDFVFTGLVDAGHSKSLILHTFLGSKFVLNKPRPIRCSACGRISPEDVY